MKKTILITGANGFLGSSMLKFLKTHQMLFNVQGIGRNECDLMDADKVQKFLQKIKPAYVFHFAGGRFNDDRQTLEANFETTKNICDAVGVLKIKTRIIVPGSAAEYGNIKTKKLITEDCLPEPLGWYGFVKLLQANLGLYYARQGLDVVVARMFNICGANTPSSLAIGGFAKQIVAIEEGAPAVIKTKNLGGKRDFLDIEDICRGLWMIAQKGKKGEVYNLCSGHPTSIRESLKCLLRHSKIKSIKVEENKKDSSLSFDVIGSNRKLRSAGSWAMQVSLEQSLKNTLDSYRQRSVSA